MPLIPPYAAKTCIAGAEVLYALRHELAETLTDVLMRRTMAAYGPKVALDVDRAAAKVAQKPSAGPGSAPTARSKGSASTSAATTPATCAACSLSSSSRSAGQLFVATRYFTPK